MIPFKQLFAPRPECIFCDGPADTTINNGKTDCCRKCKEEIRQENDEPKSHP